jgi:hypothetical protein
MTSRRVLTAGVGAVAWKIRDYALVASLLRGSGARRRGGTFTPVVWGTCGLLCRVALVYMPGEQITPGKLVSAMLALVRSIPGVCDFGWVRLSQVWTKGTDGISCAVLHVVDE